MLQSILFDSSFVIVAGICCCLFSHPNQFTICFTPKRGTHLCISPLPVHPRSWLILGSAVVFAPVSRPQAPSDLLPTSFRLQSLLSAPSSVAPSSAVSLRSREASCSVSTASSSFHPTFRYIAQAFVARPFMDHVDPLSFVRMAVGVVSGSLAPDQWRSMVMWVSRWFIIGGSDGYMTERDARLSVLISPDRWLLAHHPSASMARWLRWRW